MFQLSGSTVALKSIPKDLRLCRQCRASGFGFRLDKMGMGVLGASCSVSGVGWC